MAVTSNSFNRITFACVLGLALVTVSCGKVARTGRGPAQVVVTKLEAASGAEPDKKGGSLQSDVITEGGYVNDIGEVTMQLVLKDPGQPGVPSSPSALNAVTINRYRVSYRRADGRNAPGVDVPYGWDSAVTFTVPAEGTVTAGFQIVRHTSKLEAPLSALASNRQVISTIGDVTFYGQDQAGNEVTVTGSIGIDFANFADPE